MDVKGNLKMRAREFVVEIRKGKITKRQSQSTRGLNIYKDGTTWSSDYNGYRLGLAVASTDGKSDPDIDAESFIGKKKTTHPYTEVEQEMLKKAYKAVGATYEDPNHGDMRSQELENTNTISPVANWNKNAS